MKIYEIRLKNLNSLKGEWHIDLTDKAYDAGGIFLITGPTGAGKTTIFDAICLALYGNTPRLGRIAGNNEIMSRKTYECRARVTFESDGRKYIAEWAQHRGGRSNVLQPVKHTLAYADSGDIIEDKTGQTPGVVQQITGLDFKRFTQAVMLQQGGFDAFLRAGKQERSEILELLTGTEIYGKISTLVFIETDNEKKKLDNLTVMYENTKPRDNYESEQEIITALSESREQLALIESDHEHAKEALTWLKNIEKIKHDIADNQGRIEQKEKELYAFDEDRRKLDAGLRARELEAAYMTLTERRKNHANIKSQCEKYESEISRYNADLSKIESLQLPELVTAFTRLTRNIPENESYESVYAKAVAILETFKQFGSKRDPLNNLVDEAKNLLEKTKSELKIAQDNCKRARYVVEQALKNFEALINKRASAILEDARKNLKPGEPCPVCGSLNHPALIHGYKPMNSAINFDNEIQAAQKRVRDSQTDLEKANQKAAEAERHHGIAGTNLEQVLKNRSENDEAIFDVKAKVFEITAMAGIINPVYCGATLKILTQWHENCRELDEKIQALTKRSESLKSTLDAMNKSFDEYKSQLEILTGELENLTRDFMEKLRGKNFNSEEDFTQSRIDSRTLEKLQKKSRELEDAMTTFKALEVEYTSRLADEQARRITTESLEKMDTLSREQERKIKSLTSEITLLQKYLDDRQKIKTEREQIKQELDSQQVTYSNWAGLNALIGNKNGGKFRVFAQRITLNAMIDAANKQLERMSGRYILTAPHDNEGLRLSVIDKEQGGEIRPTENLSGGEKFIISLALALSLSQISGSKAKVESLFLDEGFGSLDDEALNTALEALGEVNSEGRMIGIISHVTALKERIAAQINVIPKREGISVITGPGCSHIL